MRLWLFRGEKVKTEPIRVSCTQKVKTTKARVMDFSSRVGFRRERAFTKETFVVREPKERGIPLQRDMVLFL